MGGPDNDILDVEVLCYICKDLVMLGNDYLCHLNYAHDIFEDDDVDNLDKKRGQEGVKNGIFQCEICCDVFKGKAVIEAHVTDQHSHIVKELEEDVGDFYVLLRAVSKQGSVYGM
eukprot:TRINITY_DN29672_c0_g1_i1.p1 TRINITY_DN29672_c0_g1~~TRINITY_DN29672_c0_g1_i1.p1  ORF type:complete len:115 (-),score=40.26 TRINITY_DN29672_c0_g1_i1:110-454(-)